jgi:hypothetical protein
MRFHPHRAAGRHRDHCLADGQWQQKSTLAMTDVAYPDAIRWPAPDGTDDLEFMRQGFNPAR